MAANVVKINNARRLNESQRRRTGRSALFACVVKDRLASPRLVERPPRFVKGAVHLWQLSGKFQPYARPLGTSRRTSIQRLERLARRANCHRVVTAGASQSVCLAGPVREFSREFCTKLPRRRAARGLRRLPRARDHETHGFYSSLFTLHPSPGGWLFFSNILPRKVYSPTRNLSHTPRAAE